MDDYYSCVLLLSVSIMTATPLFMVAAVHSAYQSYAPWTIKKETGHFQ